MAKDKTENSVEKLRDFLFPLEGVTIQAKSLKEAQAKIRKPLTIKDKDNDKTNR